MVVVSGFPFFATSLCVDFNGFSVVFSSLPPVGRRLFDSVFFSWFFACEDADVEEQEDPEVPLELLQGQARHEQNEDVP